MPVYYPPVGFHFKVEFSKAVKAKATKNEKAKKEEDSTKEAGTEFHCQEVSGLTAEVGTEELQVGGENRFSYRLPTRAKYSNLILKRGMLQDAAVAKWITNAIENFQFELVDVTVTLMNADNEPLSTWFFMKAYPVKWVTSDFKAQDNSVVVETLELVYQYFRRDPPNDSNNVYRVIKEESNKE